VYLPSPVRRRLDVRVDRAREEGFRAGLAHAAERRSRERFRYVFVVTYGRSGSTLVQGLLNVFPRVLVRGENDLYVLDLYRALARLRAFRELHGDQGSRNVVSAFYGLKAIRRSAFMQAMNDVVTTGVVGNLDAGDYDVLGFKEVVWHRIEPDETAAFFDTMDKAFPGVRYVLNTRDVERVLGSGFWRDADTDEARRLIDRVVDVQEHLRATRPDRVHDVRYEELTGADPAVRDDVVRRLGEFVTGSPVSPAVLERAREVLATGHGPFPSARQDDVSDGDGPRAD
jgi:hypothetical protein